MRLFCVALLTATFAAPAHAGFSTISFKYNSLSHLGFQRSVVQTHLPPAEAANLIADFLRANGASITSLEESSVRLHQTSGDAECERWMQTIFRAEWSAYQANKFGQFKKIERVNAPTGCAATKPSWLQYGYSVAKLTGGQGYQLTAVVDRSITVTNNVVRPKFSTIFAGLSTINMWSMFPSAVQANMNFESRFEVILWRDVGEKKTSVFVLASPWSNGVAPSPEASIGYNYRALADGHIETVAAQNLLTYVRQKSLVSSAASEGGH